MWEEFDCVVGRVDLACLVSDANWDHRSHGLEASPLEGHQDFPIGSRALWKDHQWSELVSVNLDTLLALLDLSDNPFSLFGCTSTGNEKVLVRGTHVLENGCLSSFSPCCESWVKARRKEGDNFGPAEMIAYDGRDGAWTTLRYPGGALCLALLLLLR